MKRNVGAIIVAGGSSSRMNGTDKQLAPLGGIPVIERTVKAFLSCESVREIIIVTRAEALGEITRLTEKHRKFPVSVIEGGKTRFLSAKNGFLALSDECEYIAVHDGARPLVTAETINAVITDAAAYGAAIAAAETVDTVKIAENGFVVQTPVKSSCFLAQTPQVFKRELYRKALEQAEKDGKTDFSDDAQLVEAAGVKVRVTKASRSNIKITVESDLLLAEELLKEMQIC